MKRKSIIELGAARLEVALYGRGGTLVILLPGLGGEGTDLEPLAKALEEKGWQAAAINHRGVGQSTGALDGLTLHDYAADIAGVIEYLGGVPAAVIGYAFGNRIARCVATDRPEVVSCLVLLCAGGRVPPDPHTAEMLERYLDNTLPDEVRREAAQISLFAPGNEVPESYLREMAPEAALRSQTAALETTPTEDWWNGGSAQILVVQGKDDRVAPVKNGHLLRCEFPERVSVVDIDNAGHAIVDEQPVEVAYAVIEFLKQHHPAAACP